MKWANLRTNRCPDCGSYLVGDQRRPGMILCTACAFKIGEKKMKEIIMKMITKRLQDEKNGDVDTSDGYREQEAEAGGTM